MAVGDRHQTGEVQDPRLARLEAITQETFTLWDEKRVGFSWRSYYMNHTLRVRANALAIGLAEGADLDVVAYAATLHDITKRYDGPYKVDAQGRRVVNDEGLWINEPLRPARTNTVTRLYHEMNLYSTVHHDSGAKIAERLLADEGAPTGFAQQVGHVIRGHLRPVNPPWELGGPNDPYRDPESCALFDADTIDANLGAVAFYRHVQIHGYRTLQAKGSVNLHEYVDAVGDWVQRKEEFVINRVTETGKEVAARRLATNRQIHRWLEEERQDPHSFRVAKEYGLMGVIEFWLAHAEDPNMHAELAQIESNWMSDRHRRIAAGEAPDGAEEALARVETFVGLLRGEIEGRIEG